uniref:Heavy metal translocating P-type ATPase n=2 Tax=Desmonostoc muscorum TaxID=1179 RepID=A0A8J7DHD3_DESMC
MTNIISSHERLSPQMSMSSDSTSAQHQSDEAKLNTSKSGVAAQLQAQLSSERLEIVHATTGRVRIRASEGISKSRIKNISQGLRQQYGVKEVAANEQTSSIVVSFDQKKLSLPQVLGLLQQFNIHQAQVSPTSNSQTDPFAAWKSLDFWKEQSISLIPLMTGLAVTGGLGISGLAAIPLYMITADATRWVIDCFEPEASGSENLQELKGEGTNQANSCSQNQEVQDLKGKNLTYSVVHAIPGRIRFHLPRLAEDRAYTRRLEKLIKNDPQTISVRVNSGAASIAIAYKSSQTSVNHWVNLMELALQTNPPSDPITVLEPQTSLEEVDTTTVLEDTTLEVSHTAQSDNTNVLEDTTLEVSQTTEVENTTLDLSSLWADLKPATLSYSLAMMANFPL